MTKTVNKDSLVDVKVGLIYLISSSDIQTIDRVPICLCFPYELLMIWDVHLFII